MLVGTYEEGLEKLVRLEREKEVFTDNGEEAKKDIENSVKKRKLYDDMEKLKKKFLVPNIVEDQLQCNSVAPKNIHQKSKSKSVIYQAKQPQQKQIRSPSPSFLEATVAPHSEETEVESLHTSRCDFSESSVTPEIEDNPNSDPDDFDIESLLSKRRSVERSHSSDLGSIVETTIEDIPVINLPSSMCGNG